MTEFVRFNLSDYVRVKLTASGRGILYKQHQELVELIFSKNPNATPIPFKINEDDQGWSRWQLHTLISKFGAAVSVGGPLPFELEIKLEIHT